MTKYIVHGGKPLFGEVEISGAKNAAVAIIPAAILVDGVCRIENIPQISDVTAILKILEQLGASIRSINRHTVEIDSRHVHSTTPSFDLVRRIRASYYLLGALLGRFGKATVAMPGGCNFGVRGCGGHRGESGPGRGQGRPSDRGSRVSGHGQRRRHHEHHDGCGSGRRHHHH